MPKKATADVADEYRRVYLAILYLIQQKISVLYAAFYKYIIDKFIAV